MSGGLLRGPPSEAELERLYLELAREGAPSVGRERHWRYHPEGLEALFALAGEMLRYDARLLSILIQWILQAWSRFNPLQLRRQMARMRWPQALCVVLDFARLASHDPEFRRFGSYVCQGWPRISAPERFFIGSFRPESRTAARRLGRNLAPYARWGFVGTERPTANAHTKTTLGRYDSATRKNILESMVAEGRSVTLAEYLEAVDHAVSRQQALTDLRAAPGVRLRGRGPGARWSRSSSVALKHRRGFAPTSQ